MVDGSGVLNFEPRTSNLEPWSDRLSPVAFVAVFCVFRPKKFRRTRRNRNTKQLKTKFLCC